MSSYVNFYLKKDNVFCPLASFSRLTKYYQKFSPYLPYEKCAAITKDLLSSIKNEVILDTLMCNASIKEAEKMNEFLKNSNDPLESKVTFFLENNRSIRGEEMEKTDLENLSHFIDFLLIIIDEAEDYHGYSINPEGYIYGGIECYDPTEEDIVK